MSVYTASEDSFLLEQNIPSDLAGKKVLEIGCGSGIISVIAARNGADVAAVDINHEAVKATKKLAELSGFKIKALKSDLFEKVRGKFDLIVFNPPYVACECERLEGEEAWAGGKDGRELIDRFLKEFKKHLTKNGEALLLVSSQNKIKNELERDNWLCVDFLKLGDEELFIMRYKNAD
ncbi:methyltransferase [Candidatus Micrarchaeota archaeon]|nr:methyltransferase [Candidatus Micrarchaeota archaeon]